MVSPPEAAKGDHELCPGAQPDTDAKLALTQARDTEGGLWAIEQRRLDAGRGKAGVSPFLSANVGSCPDRLPGAGAGPPQSGLSPQEGAPGPHSVSPRAYRCGSRAQGETSLAQVAGGAAVLSHSPAEVGQDLGGRTEPPPAQLPSVISQLPQLRSSALRVLQGPPSSADPQVSSRLFTALLGTGLPSHFTDGEPEAAVGRMHGSLVRHAGNDPALSKDVLRRPPKPLAVLLWGPGAEGEGSLMALDWAGWDVAGTRGLLGLDQYQSGVIPRWHHLAGSSTSPDGPARKAVWLRRPLAGQRGQGEVSAAGQRLAASWAGQAGQTSGHLAWRGDCNDSSRWALGSGSRQGSRLHRVYKQTQQQPHLKAEELGIQLDEEVAGGP